MAKGAGQSGDRGGRARSAWLAFAVIMLITWVTSRVWFTVLGLQWTAGDLIVPIVQIAAILSAIVIEVRRRRRA